PVSGSPAACAFLISSPSSAAHSVQANKPLWCRVSARANACASHGSRNTGPCVSQGMVGTASVARRSASGSIDPISDRLQIWLKGINGDNQAGLRVVSPQLSSRKTDRIKPLWVLTFAEDDRIREHVTAVEALHST